MRARSRRATAARGFTLVELLMALTAGLLVSSAAFLLARNASTAFQEETRITAAQLSASLGLQRLATDISRAGFLTTANIQTDPFVCNEAATWPTIVSTLRAVKLEENGSAGAHPADLTQSINNGFRPDRITIAASTASAEMFPVRTIEDAGGGKIVYLETVNMPILRTCRGQPLAACDPVLQRIFKHDRILRILTPSGREIFGLIERLEITDKIKVWLQSAPNVPSVAYNPRGYEGDCNYCLANTVSVFRYEIQSLQGNAQYGSLVAPQAVSATGDGGRTELTRVELDKDGNPMMDTLELVSEFAVDLKFGISTIDQSTTAVTDMPISQPANPLVYTSLPERIRSIQVRLSTRSRVPDRDVDVAPGPDGRRPRFQLPIAGKTTYARMRTLYTDVGLQNMVRNTW